MMRCGDASGSTVEWELVYLSVRVRVLAISIESLSWLLLLAYLNRRLRLLKLLGLHRLTRHGARTAGKR